MTEPTEPSDPWEADRLAGREELAQRGTPQLHYVLRIEVHVPVSRGALTDEALIESHELDIDTTAVLVARAGYDALNRDLRPGTAATGPVDALLALAAAARHADLVQAAIWTDQLVDARVILRVVARHPRLPYAEPESAPQPVEPGRP